MNDGHNDKNIHSIRQRKTIIIITYIHTHTHLTLFLNILNYLLMNEVYTQQCCRHLRIKRGNAINKKIYFHFEIIRKASILVQLELLSN